jgi:hypothetical protein
MLRQQHEDSAITKEKETTKETKKEEEQKPRKIEK